MKAVLPVARSGRELAHYYVLMHGYDEAVRICTDATYAEWRSQGGARGEAMYRDAAVLLAKLAGKSRRDVLTSLWEPPVDLPRTTRGAGQ